MSNKYIKKYSPFLSIREKPTETEIRPSQNSLIRTAIIKNSYSHHVGKDVRKEEPS